MAQKKRSPDATWDALEKMAVDDEVERVAALSDEELDRDLKEMGFDPARVRERGRVLAASAFARAAGDAPNAATPAPSPARSVPLGPIGSRPRRYVGRGATWAVLAAAAVALAAGFALLQRPTFDPMTAPPAGTPSARALAADLRAKADRECRAAAWAPCLADLDEAKALDPAGDAEPSVRAARAAANAALAGDAAGR